ncbi:ammonium transporter [Pseudonocardia ailaonensis]
MLASTALVLFMTPGLALFYGGMVRSKSVLNMMMMSLSAMGLVGVLWVLYGYSLAFGNDVGGGLLGSLTEFWGLKGLFVGTYTGDAISFTLSGSIPALVFVGFQATFAIITVALISGAVADRMKFGAWLLFAGIWATVVYFPVAHWVFAFTSTDGSVVGGWIANSLKAIDFAGGTAVHINAGVAALALAIIVGKRRGWPREPMRPHNLTLVMLGAGILWFGWFGFNAGSALGANGTAAFTMVNTIVATCAAMLAWLVVERIRDGKATTLGAASGIVAGLVAITPSCSSVSPLGAIALGAIASVLCALAVGLKYRFGFDDSLDVVGVHLVGGIAGTVLVGFFADPGSPAAVAGLFYGGGADQLWRQAVGALAVLLYSGILTFIIALIVKGIFRGKIRIDEEAEVAGIDESEHAETAYDFSSHRGLGGLAGSHAAAQAAAVAAPSKEGVSQ